MRIKAIAVVLLYYAGWAASIVAISYFLQYVE